MNPFYQLCQIRLNLEPSKGVRVYCKVRIKVVYEEKQLASVWIYYKWRGRGGERETEGGGGYPCTHSAYWTDNRCRSISGNWPVNICQLASPRD